MARASVQRNYYTFVGGKHSDSNPINPQPNTARTLLNVDLESNGKLSRRLGMDLEDNFVLDTDELTFTDIRSVSVDSSEWFNVDNSDTATFFVLRIANKIYFYDESVEPFSSSLVGSLDISSFATSETSAATSKIQTASGKGLLFVVGEFYNPFFVEFDPTGATFSGKLIKMERRDFAGLDDGLDIQTRPSTLSDIHHYNLLNQGWTESHINLFKSVQGVFPSDADIDHLGYKVNSSGDRVWDSNEIVQHTLGNTRAPQGHFILDIFEENRIEASGVLGLPAGGTTFRPRSVGFFAGRVWYASVKGEIFFSQIVTDEDRLGRCYQEQDPSSDDLNELLDTDGGVISLTEAGSVVKALPASNGIALFATNGIWLISGGDTSFTANTTFVASVSKVKITNPDTIVEAEDVIFFWSEEGIYALIIDNVSGNLVASSLSEGRVQRDFDVIPTIAKVLAQGTYDRIEKKVYWSYHDSQTNDANNIEAKHNAMIVFDKTINAFWDYTISDVPSTSTPAFIAGTVKRSSVNEGSSTENVVVNGEVVEENGVTVVVTVTFNTATNHPLKTICFVPNVSLKYQVTFGEFCSRSFTDWKSVTGTAGIDYKSVIETNPELLGEGSVDKQATYLLSFYDFQRGGFGELEASNRFDPSEGFRVTQNVVEILRSGLPKLRATQNVVEVLRANV